MTLLFDRQGRLWVGTQGGGIDVLEDARAGAPRRFRRIGAAQGLGNLNADTLLLDRDGRVWASTDASCGRSGWPTAPISPAPW